MASNDADDEVSTLLRHLSPRPGFVASHGSDHEWMGKRKRAGRLRRRDRGFSSVRHEAAPSGSGGSGIVRLAYLHVQDVDRGSCCIHAFLEFEMEVGTKAVRCVQYSAPADSVSAALKQHVDGKCKELCDASTAGESLFSIASRLLQLLNRDIPSSCMYNVGDIAKQPSREATLGAMIHRFATTVQPKRPFSAIHRLLHLQTLLMRCAAAGRTRSHTCAPVPAEFARSEGERADAVSHLVFDASNQLYLHGFGGDETQQQLQKSEAVEAAWTLLAYLLSLPWTGGSRLTREKPTNIHGNGGTMGNGDQRNSKTSPKNLVGRLSFDIGTALGDPTPTFARLANKYGTVQAYHGTKIESAWSILNYGLQNLSYNGALAQNGAMMGEGVYLSSSRQVAESFAIGAAERPPPALPLAFQHEALLHLLCHASVDVVTLDPLDTYDIKCLPVFEATIIQPPPRGTDSEETEESTPVTRQEGKYFVCANSEFVRISRLHLTIELAKKSDVWHRWLLPRLPLTFIVLIVAMFWAMM